MAAGSGSGSSKGLRKGVEAPCLIVRRAPGGGFVVETVETDGGVVMATIIGCMDADRASRVIHATLQDLERRDDAACAAARAAREISGTVA